MINFFILINTTEGKDTTYGMKKFRPFASWQVPWSCISKESPRTETMEKRRKEESRNSGENETMRFERRKMMYHCNNNKNYNANKGTFLTKFAAYQIVNEWCLNEEEREKKKERQSLCKISVSLFMLEKSQVQNISFALLSPTFLTSHSILSGKYGFHSSNLQSRFVFHSCVRLSLDDL